MSLITCDECGGSGCEVCEGKGWVRNERPSLAPAPRPALQELVEQWQAQGEAELREATDRHMCAAMGVAAMRLHCARELAAALREASGEGTARAADVMAMYATGWHDGRHASLSLMEAVQARRPLLEYTIAAAALREAPAGTMATEDPLLIETVTIHVVNHVVRAIYRVDGSELAMGIGPNLPVALRALADTVMLELLAAEDRVKAAIVAHLDGVPPPASSGEAPAAPLAPEDYWDVCRSCGHYRAAHTATRCDGWMPAGAGHHLTACPCAGFTALPASSGARPADKDQD